MKIDNELGFLIGENSNEANKKVRYPNQEELYYLNNVDIDFRNLIRELYKIPGVATFPPSCSGHFEVGVPNKECFYPRIGGRLPIATIPSLEHIPSLLNIFYQHSKTDQDTILAVKDINHPYVYNLDLAQFSPDLELEEPLLTKLNSDNQMLLLEFRIGENNCFSRQRQPNATAFNLSETELFEDTIKRYYELREFWKCLEEKVIRYNKVNNFENIDFSKIEFLPFH